MLLESEARSRKQVQRLQKHNKAMREVLVALHWNIKDSDPFREFQKKGVPLGTIHP